jgi:hypothetical protein
MSQLPYLIVPKPTPTNYLVLLNNKNTEHNWVYKGQVKKTTSLSRPDFSQKKIFLILKFFFLAKVISFHAV